MDKEGKGEGQMIAEEKEKSQISNSTLNHVICNLIDLMVKGNCMHWIFFLSAFCPLEHTVALFVSLIHDLGSHLYLVVCNNCNTVVNFWVNFSGLMQVDI